MRAAGGSVAQWLSGSVAQWLWLGLRYRSATLPSVVNSAIETGGLAGESKLACLERIDPDYADSVARTLEVAPGQDPEALRQAAGMAFPLIAKPDIGWCGYGVRRIADTEDLRRYAAALPRQAVFLLQDFVPGSGEAGLFYMRGPAEAHGRLIAITVRHQPQVTGDGHRTIAQAIAADPRLAPMMPYYRESLGTERLARVPGMGETVLLSTVASLRVGGRYEDAMSLLSPALEARVDAIACSMRGFHFGRFTGNAALRDGIFQNIEVNGAGSEAIQFWDPSVSLFDAYRGVFAKQAMLVRLAAEFRAAGHRPIGLPALARAWWAQLRLMRRYPASN
jgi:hypothetical protein